MALAGDFKFALRQLSRAKVFTIVAVLTVGLGIGCNTAIFSVFYGVLMRPLPFPEPDRLVLISEHTDRFPLLSASWKNFSDWRSQSTSFQEFGAVRSLTMSLTDKGDAEQIPSQMISGNLLHMLGVQPSLGRALVESDDMASSRAVAMLGYGLWQRKYSSSPDVVGQPIRLNGQSYTIIGVLPKGYELLQQKPDAVVAMTPWAIGLPDDRSWHPGIYPIARLKAGVSLQSARVEMTTIAKRLLAQYPVDNIALDAIVNLDARAVGEGCAPRLAYLAWSNRVCTAHRLRQHCESSAYARYCPAQRNVDSHCPGRFRFGKSCGSSLLRDCCFDPGRCCRHRVGGAFDASLLRAAAASLPPAADVRIDTHVLLFTIAVSICAGVVFGILPAVHLRLVDLRSVQRN